VTSSGDRCVHSDVAEQEGSDVFIADFCVVKVTDGFLSVIKR